MNPVKNSLRTPLSLALGSAMVAFGLTACGGGGGGSDGAAADAAPPPANPNEVTLRGQVVINAGVSNATVCVDLNANQACDATEPVASPTAADGRYVLVYDKTQHAPAAVNASTLLAKIPTTARDTSAPAEPFERDFVMSAAVADNAQINPLTTLVQTARAAGQTLADARRNVAQMLHIDENKIDNYLDDPAFDFVNVNNSARMKAYITGAALNEGIVLAVDEQTRAQHAVDGDLLSLRYTDAGNVSYRSLAVQAKPAGSAGFKLTDVRGGLTAGAPTPAAELYNIAYLNPADGVKPAGWTRCDTSVDFHFSQGTPNDSRFCSGSESFGFAGPAVDIADRPMVDVVNELLANPATSSINSGLAAGNLLAALGAATFPAGSSYRMRANISLTQPIFINSISTDAISQGVATTLDELVTAFPSSAVTDTTGGLSLGLGSGEFKNLRVAFTAAPGEVQFYECDLDATRTIRSNCAPTQAGTYQIDTINGARVMRYFGFAPTVMDHVRMHAEVKFSTQVNGVVGSGDWIFVVRQEKPGVDFAHSEQNRLNGTAWGAMKTQLGL